MSVNLGEKNAKKCKKYVKVCKKYCKTLLAITQSLLLFGRFASPCTPNGENKYKKFATSSY